MKKLTFAIALILAATSAHADQQCTKAPVLCADNYATQPGSVTVAATNPASTCASQYITVTLNDTATRITYGSNGWCTSGQATCVSNKGNACINLASAISAVSGITSAICAGYKVIVTPNPLGLSYFNLATSTTGCATVANPRSGGIVRLGQSLISEGGTGALTVYARDGSTAGTVTVGTIVAPTVTATTIDKATTGTLAIAPTNATAVTIGKSTTLTGDLNVTGNLTSGGSTSSGVWTGASGDTIDNPSASVIRLNQTAGTAENLTLTASSDLWTAASTTGATIAITPSLAVAGYIKANGGIGSGTTTATAINATSGATTNIGATATPVAITSAGAVTVPSTLGVTGTTSLTGGWSVTAATTTGGGGSSCTTACGGKACLFGLNVTGPALALCATTLVSGTCICGP